MADLDRIDLRGIRAMARAWADPNGYANRNGGRICDAASTVNLLLDEIEKLMAERRDLAELLEGARQEIERMKKEVADVLLLGRPVD